MAYAHRASSRAGFVILALASGLMGGAGRGEEGGTKLEFLPLPCEGPESAFHGTVDELRAVVRGEEHWRALWSELTRRFLPRPPAPRVDFEESMVLVISRGECPTGGYAVRFTKVVEGRTGIRAHVQVQDPSPDAVVTQAATYPIAIALVRRNEKPVRFLVRGESD